MKNDSKRSALQIDEEFKDELNCRCESDKFHRLISMEGSPLDLYGSDNEE